MTRTATTIVRIYVPVSARGRGELLHDPAVARILQVLADGGVGHVGRYANVVEVAAGSETFMSLKGSHPRRGSVGSQEVVPVAIITSYFDRATVARLDDVLDQVVEAHPWEHPVIEVHEGRT